MNKRRTTQTRRLKQIKVVPRIGHITSFEMKAKNIRKAKRRSSWE